MLKPLETEFKGRTITLECTHKRAFPPPQMYGSTPEDIDNLWRQGRVDQGQYQHLKTWREACGLMIMGPKCLDCPLALKQNPRPGRPHVYETEPWLDAKDRIHWEDMKAGKLAHDPSDTEAPPEPEPTLAETLAKGNTGETTVEMPPEPEAGSPEAKAAEEALLESAPEPEPVKAEAPKKKRSSKRRSKKKAEAPPAEPEPVPPPAAVPEGAPSKREVAAEAENLDAPPTEAETNTEADKKPLVAEAPAPALDESILDALADD